MRSVKSVALVRATVGRMRPISASASGNHGTMNVSPPVMPMHVNPSSRAWCAASTMAPRSSDRRSRICGEDSVRQYEHVRLQW